MQSTLHIAIIMDGNGRWALERGMTRVDGHHQGAEAVRRTVEAAARRGVGFLTLYAFSSDNWKRPEDEVRTLMTLFGRFLDAETPRCAREGVRMNVIGRRDRLDRDLVASVERAEAATRAGTRMLLRIAVDYSSREAIARAARILGARRDFERALLEAVNSASRVPPVDLLIRTGREKRLSDFMLWESAYAELWFSDVMWPEFGDADLGAAMEGFRGRERRFGALPRVSRPDRSEAARGVA